MHHRLAILGLTLMIGSVAATTASACQVSYPLPPAVLQQDAEREGRAWAEAPIVYLAEVTGVGSNFATYELTPRHMLKGNGQVSVLDVPSVPSRGICLQYHGLNVADGADLGDQFVVYARTDPVSPDALLVVSARMVGDPSTRAALRSRRVR